MFFTSVFEWSLMFLCFRCMFCCWSNMFPIVCISFPMVSYWFHMLFYWFPLVFHSFSTLSYSFQLFSCGRFRKPFQHVIGGHWGIVENKKVSLNSHFRQNGFATFLDHLDGRNACFYKVFHDFCMFHFNFVGNQLHAQSACSKGIACLRKRTKSVVKELLVWVRE